MLVIEGADCVGKSTLVKKLAKIFKNKGLSVTQSHLGAEASQWTVGDYVKCIQRWHIQDRFHLSERAYGEVFRNGPKLSENEIKLLTAKIKELGGIVLVITTGAGLYNRLLSKYHSTRPEMYDDFYALDRVNTIYKNMSNKMYTNKFYITCDEQGTIHWPSDSLLEDLARMYMRLSVNIGRMGSL